MRSGQFSHEQVARVFYAALRQLRAEQGCSKGPVWDLLTAGEQRWYCRSVELARAGLLPPQIHGAWAQEMIQAGWACGENIDHMRRTHPELGNWDELDGKYRLRFIALQAWTTTLTIDVPPVWDAPHAVTSL
jgi:RyR domain